jgi:molecular chaperone GrpE
MEQNENMNNEQKAAADETKEAKTTEATEASSPEVKVEPKKEEVDYKSKYFYLAAEMENTRKRMEREKETLLKFGNEKVLSDLVSVLDNFERTVEMLKHDEDPKVKNIVIGIEMVGKLFTDTLSKHGLTPVQSIGKDFDPNVHEALAQEYQEGKKPNEVIKEFQKGYSLNGRLLRAAKVVVSSDKQ